MANTRPALWWTFNHWHVPTYHFEVFGAALHPPVVAGEQHVLDVVARPVIEFAHVEGAGLVAVEVSPLLQGQQDALLDQVRVPDLIPGNLRSEDIRGGGVGYFNRPSFLGFEDLGFISCDYQLSLFRDS